MHLYHSVKLKAPLSLSSACKLARATCICCMGPLLHTHPPALLCTALRKLSPPVGLCVSASHQTRLYHSKQAVRRMLPREKTVSAAHTVLDAGKRRSLYPQWHSHLPRRPSVQGIHLLWWWVSCCALSYLWCCRLCPFSSICRLVCLLGSSSLYLWRLKKTTTCWLQIEITIAEHILFLE